MAQVFDLGQQVQRATQIQGLGQANKIRQQQLQDLETARTRAQTLAGLRPQAIQGDAQALNQIAAIDPAAAQEITGFQTSRQQQQAGSAEAIQAELQRYGALGQNLLRFPAEQRPRVLAQSLGAFREGSPIRQSLEQLVQSGQPIPDELIQEEMAGLAQIFEQEEFATSPIQAQTPDGQPAFVQVSDRGNVRQVQGAQPPAPEPDAIQRRTSALVEAGVEPDIARGIASGRFELRTDPISGQTNLVDLGQSQPVSTAQASMDDDLANLPQDDFVNPLPQEGERTLAAGTGSLEQAVKGALNTGAQLLGADPVFPGQVTSNTAVQNLGRDTALALSSTVDGRTSNLRYQAFLETQAQPFNGEAQARSRVRETIDQLTSRIREAEQFAMDPRADRTIRRNAQNQIGELRRLRQRWVELVEGGEQSQQPEGQTIRLQSGREVRVIQP
ncbi:MAG TPA: hypothetical protein VIG24_12490 [Acidimicrobiia bacterium]